MKILSFEFHDAVRGWTLEPMALEAFNLLVGVSGAGKTRIVRAIETVCAVALGTKDTEKEAEEAGGARFAIEFEHDGLAYRWDAELEPPAWRWTPGSNPTAEGELPLIRTERLSQGERVVVDRSPERLLFNGSAIPKLDRAKSAIGLLKEEPTIAPLHVAFSRCIFRMLEILPTNSIGFQEIFDREREKYRTVQDLGADFSMPLHHKAEFLQELFPDAFLDVAESFREAFPSVLELKLQRYLSSAASPELHVYNAALAFRESGVDKWVFFSDMSSGMQRYLSFLIHLSFAPRGTVVLIDELELSLGVNLLPAATRFLLQRAPDLQLILTSHHPYIIEQIPPSHWKIVTRKGSRVRVLDAAAIAALGNERSHLDRFTRLINLPEYEQGIQG